MPCERKTDSAQQSGSGLFSLIRVNPFWLLPHKWVDTNRQWPPRFAAGHEIRHYINCQCHKRAATQGSLTRTSEKWTQDCRWWRNEPLKWQNFSWVRRRWGGFLSALWVAQGYSPLIRKLLPFISFSSAAIFTAWVHSNTPARLQKVIFLFSKKKVWGINLVQTLWEKCSDTYVWWKCPCSRVWTQWTCVHVKLII